VRSELQARLQAMEVKLKQSTGQVGSLEGQLGESRRALVDEKARGEAEKQKLIEDLSERVRLVTRREAGMGTAMAKVMKAEEAMEACLTCMACMGLLKEPATCTPCGHTFCASCLKAESGGGGAYMLAVCPECDGAAGKVVTVSTLGTLTSKFEFQRQQLAELQVGAKAAAAVGKLSAGLNASRPTAQAS